MPSTPRRVYIAGLSAGAAAAAVMGGDLSRSVCGARRAFRYRLRGSPTTIPSAFAAMRQGEVSASSRSGYMSGDMSAVCRARVGGSRPSFFMGIGTTRCIRATAIISFRQNRTAKLQTKNASRSGARRTRIYPATIHARRGVGGQSSSAGDIHGAGARLVGRQPRRVLQPIREGPDAAREMLRFFLEHPRPVAHAVSDSRAREVRNPKGRSGSWAYRGAARTQGTGGHLGKSLRAVTGLAAGKPLCSGTKRWRLQRTGGKRMRCPGCRRPR